MIVEVNVKFNIGDRVIIKKPLGGAVYYAKQGQLITGTIVGYVIHKTEDRTQVYYKVHTSVGYENKKYQASGLELYKEN